MGLGRFARMADVRRALRYARHLWTRVRPAAKRHGIGAFRIVREQIKLKRSAEIQPDEYFYYGLDDPKMPWEEKASYVGHMLLRKLWFLLTPERYHVLYKNKLAFKRFFSAAGFPLAHLYGVYDPIWGYSEDGQPLRNKADMADWMASTDVREVVFKPIESAEGRMVLVMGGRKPSNNGHFVTLCGKEYSPEELVAYFRDPIRLREAYPEETPLPSFLAEERLHSHPAIKSFAPDTLCCARIVTLTTLKGDVRVIETAMKLQSKPVGADNVTQGSVAIEVDPESGTLGTGLMANDLPEARRRCLPESQKEFSGFKLPFWKEGIALAKAAAAAFPEAHAVGWDIALTERGPYLVDGNPAWGEFQAECREGLMKGAFKELVEQLKARQSEP